MAVGLTVAGCSPGIETKMQTANPSATESVATSAPSEPKVPTAPPSTEPPSSESPAIEGKPAIEVVVGCNRKTIGEESGPIAVGYAVENGRLAPTPCFGEASAVVEAAWFELAIITPPQLIRGVTILAGFDDAESDTLAFAGPVANDSDDHLVAVGITAAVADPQELRLTMAHELAHVFTQTSDQIDVAFFSDECDTFFNGFGCFEQDAYMTAWIDQFWTVAELNTLPDDYAADLEGGDRRCSIDAGFPGSYSASHPEEDFAEAFSAYVFGVEMPPGVDERLSFFDGYPEFVAMRLAISRLDASVPQGNFDECG